MTPMVQLPEAQDKTEYHENPILFWNHVALELNRLVHTLERGPQTGPALSSRALGILHLAMHDAYFAIRPDDGFETYLSDLPSPPKNANTRSAIAGAAIKVLKVLYTSPGPVKATTAALTRYINDVFTVALLAGLVATHADFKFGEDVATAVLDLLIVPGEPGAATGDYKYKEGAFYFRADPNNPTDAAYGPKYGDLTRRLAVQMKVGGEDVKHIIADPPLPYTAELHDAVKDVIRSGCIRSDPRARRTAKQEVMGHFFAYDGANLIGTPPRLYNQILRRVAVEHCKVPDAPLTDERNVADFARLFALCNAALADAGIMAWREKYCFEYWRPLSGVREYPGGADPSNAPKYTATDDPDQSGGDLADPFFQTVGAPDTNQNGVPKKPPFPAYPSGHATFGGAFFQMARLYYRERDGLDFPVDGPDNICLSKVESEELNGVSRDLRNKWDINLPIEEQAGTVRTKVQLTFPSLWSIMYQNALSRVFLGVHWRFDSFAAEDVLVSEADDGKFPFKINDEGYTVYKPESEVRYTTLKTRTGCDGLFPVGGVPLGIGIANDIWEGKLKPTPTDKQPQ